MGSVFHFKLFTLSHQQSTMKVGTDSMIMGSWLPVEEHHKDILDIGTGSGIVALMLAQRSSATIDAIDVHGPSVKEARQNFINSPWASRLKAIHIPLEEYKPQENKKYDLIVSNPPFFVDSWLPKSERLQIAKHNRSLSLVDLISHADRLLCLSGQLALILPADLESTLLTAAKKNNLFVCNQLDISPKEGKAIHRIVYVFSRNQNEISRKEHLIIRDTKNGYTEHYKSLTAEYHAEGYL